MCECGHPVWAHETEINYGSEETGVWTTAGACNWDWKGETCECQEFKAKRS